MPIAYKIDEAPVLYWDSIIAPKLNSEPIQAVLDQLNQGQYSAAGLKKLAGYSRRTQIAYANTLY